MVHQRFNLRLLIALCGITHVHIVLPDVLDYTLCHYRVWNSVISIKMSSKVEVRKYFDKILFSLCPRVYHVCWGAFSLYALIPLWQKMEVNLDGAHKKTDLHAAHEALLVRFFLSCITRIITHVQCMKNSSRAVHKS